MIVKQDVPQILLVNPWIYDFAAFDFWSRPLGLFMLGALLQRQGYGIRLLDCLDRFHPRMTTSHQRRGGRFGTGHYPKTPMPKPHALADVPRNYARYGISERLFRHVLEQEPRPDLVLMTSMMTYWYPGVFAAIRIIKDILPGTPIYLGGIYATLCYDHAVVESGADEVLAGANDGRIMDSIARIVGYAHTDLGVPDNLDNYPYPCMDQQSAIAFAPILTGRGCPFHCHYCASGFLNPSFQRRSPDSVVDEIGYWHHKHGVVDFVFYDDALLVDAENHILPILEKIVTSQWPVRFHTPNALHVRLLDRKIASLMFQAGFKTIRLGLETAFLSERETLDKKVGPDEFEKAANYLMEAGFSRDTVGAYLLFGLPGQDMGQLENSIGIVKDAGILPVLAQYSPIPHTALWEEAVRLSRYDLAADPIFHNNSIFPCQKEPFSWEMVSMMKQLTQ